MVSGLVTVPSVVASGETVSIPAGRTLVHPNLQVDGTLRVDGTLFIPSGGSVSTTEVDATVVKQNGNVVANDSTVVHKTGDETIAGIKTFGSFPILPSSNPTTSYQAVHKAYVDANAVPDATETTKGKVALATNAEVYAVTNTTKAITPAGLLSAFVNSKVANGYTKLPNGLIIQWGSGATGARTLPIAFPTAGLKGFATQVSHYGSNANVCVTGVTTTTLTISGEASVTYNFLAIGY